MAHSDVKEAFAILIDELNNVLKQTREEAARASRQGQYESAQARIEEARHIEKFIQDIRAKQKEWQRLTRRHRRPRKAKRSAKRLSRGERTPGEAHRLPILRALVALGGEAPMQQVLDRVYQEMKHELKPVDLEPLPSSPETPRWRNAAQWERFRMVQEGLLRADSPRGIWAITRQGRAFLQREGSRGGRHAD